MSCCKVAQAIDTFGLEEEVVGGDLNEGLKDRYIGRGERESMGTRPLADWFNMKILRTVYVELGRQAIAPRLEADYEALTGDDETAKHEVMRDLDGAGIEDVVEGGAEGLVNSFVSQSTMYRHLTDHLDAEKAKDSGVTDLGEWLENRKQFLESQVENHGSEMLERVARTDQLPGADEANINGTIYVSCPVCSSQVELSAALSRGYICKDHLGEREATADEKNADESLHPGASTHSLT